MRLLHIAFVIPGIPFDGNTLTEKSLGGSETAALCMARELAALGNRVYVFNNCEQPGDYAGVQYLPIQDYTKFAAFTPHDVTVVQRTPEFFGTRNLAKMNILWCHDLPLYRYAGAIKSVLWNVDRVALLSDFMVEKYKKIYDLTEPVILQTRNGIDLGLFNAFNEAERDPNKLLYTARPERGLDTLLRDILPAILKRRPATKLYLAAYDNPAPQLEPFYGECRRLAAGLGDSVVNLGALSKPDLYQHMAQARVLVYPTPSPFAPHFAEISCITAMECMASGLPMVTSNHGALPETLDPNAGDLINGTPGEDAYTQAFVDAVCNLLENPERWQAMSDAGRQAAKNCRWSDVAAEWDATIREFLKFQGDNPKHAAYGFARVGDRQVARVCNQGQPIKLPGEVDRSADRVTDQIICKWLAEDPGIKRVLDIGGRHEHLYNNFPEVRFHVESQSNQYDALIASSEVEYAIDPWECLAELMDNLRPGGTFIGISTWGAWRTGGRHWNLDSGDWEEMAQHLPKFNVYSIFSGMNERSGEVTGWIACRFQRPDTEFTIHRVDIQQKIELTRPEQFLSANLIAGPNCEQTLRWCLESIQNVADEIVIADTGMNSEAKTIARDYGARLVPSPSPLQAGFDVPRNKALQASNGTWILWIDTDECLIDGINLRKYLRTKFWYGYAIRQHHFCVDTYFKPDMPVRLFRTDLPDGEQLKFYGMIHEHPELEMNKGPGPIIILGDLHIAHVGYLTESVRRKRFMRNNPLLVADRKKNPDRIFGAHLLMRDNMLMCAAELQMNGNRVTERIRAMCQETIALFREHFLGQEHYTGLDSINYYSDACKILDMGVDIHFQVIADRGNDGKDMPQPCWRFATLADFEKELAFRGREMSKILFKDEY